MGIDIVLSEDSSTDRHPGTTREDASDVEDQPEWSEQEQDNIPEPPRLDLAYSAEFNIFSDLAAAPESHEELNRQPVDADRWELVITPDEYLQRFKDTRPPFSLSTGSLCETYTRPTIEGQTSTNGCFLRRPIISCGSILDTRTLCSPHWRNIRQSSPALYRCRPILVVSKSLRLSSSTA